MKVIFRQDCNDKLQQGTTVNPNLSPPFLMFANTIAFIPILKTTSFIPHLEDYQLMASVHNILSA